MVTSLYDWKILEWDDKPQNKPQKIKIIFSIHIRITYFRWIKHILDINSDVNMQHIYIHIQHEYAKMLDEYVHTQLKLCCMSTWLKLYLSNGLFFFERCSLITTTVCAYKLNNARKRTK